MLRRSTNSIGSLFLVAAIAGPALMVSEAKAQEASVQLRIYDGNHKDYHNWNDREDRAYRGYLVSRHKTYRTYQKQDASTQRHYWDWRHSHPDHD